MSDRQTLAKLTADYIENRVGGLPAHEGLAMRLCNSQWRRVLDGLRLLQRQEQGLVQDTGGKAFKHKTTCNESQS